MPSHSNRSLAQRVGGALARTVSPSTTLQSSDRTTTNVANGDVSNKKSDTQSILHEIGIVGCEGIEPLIIASLVTEDPLLLIGPHGTGKSFVLNQISAALGIEWRHYNASILNFDDLIGFPVPDQDGSLKYIETENSIWGANAVFFDEISRCRPDIQNKMFPIVHERRVQGIELKGLRYRWAAMNPPMTDESEEEDYLGSEPLDLAFADRFAFVIDMPNWDSFTDRQKKAIIQNGATSITQPLSRLTKVIQNAKELVPTYHDSHGEQVSEYVFLVSSLLDEAGISLSPRRTNMIFRSIIAAYATAMSLGLGTNYKDLTYLVLKNSFPLRCTGKKIKDLKVLTAHNAAWQIIRIEKNSTLGHLSKLRFFGVFEPRNGTRMRFFMKIW